MIAPLPEIDHAPWPSSPRPPAWITALLPTASLVVETSFEVPADLPPTAFQQAVTAAYRSLFAAVEGRPGMRPVRFWAFLPGIHEAAGAGLDRYMVFNAGRHDAFAAHFGAPMFGRGAIPTASAVGIPGRRLHLYCLAADVDGVAVENPRQIPAYRYSPRFGPRPPAFARATRLTGPTGHGVLLVGGTASIRGEESLHVDGLERQLDETCLNLASVVAAAHGAALPSDRDGAAVWLRRYIGVRVYYVRPADRDTVRAVVAAAMSPDCTIELVPATLCRAELLVEIEGVADLGTTPAAGRA